MIEPYELISASRAYSWFDKYNNVYELTELGKGHMKGNVNDINEELEVQYPTTAKYEIKKRHQKSY